MKTTRILILYYSRNGATARLARHIADGVERASDAGAPVEALLRTVPPVMAAGRDVDRGAAVPADGPPYATPDDLERADGLIAGSPTRFGIMAAPLKHFIDGTGSLWASGTLVDRPFAVFTSTSTQHGGQESTLLGMALPWLHHGMLWAGIPFTEARLSHTQDGGTPYGASHIARSDAAEPEYSSADERALAEALGLRVARLAQRLAPRDERS